MRSPSASIIVPSRGGRLHLPLLFAALNEQDCDDFEVIVVIDGDIDSSEEYLESQKPQTNFPLRSIVFPQNRGRVSALNAGADAALGRVLIRCDDDLVPASDYVSGHLAHHQGEPCGVVGLCKNIYPETNYARVYGRPNDIKFRNDAIKIPNTLTWHYWGGNVSIPRSVHMDLGGYDPRYVTYGWEDVDFGYRLSQNGIPVVLDPLLTTDHRVAATTTSIRALRALHSGAARESFLTIHGPDSLENAAPAGLWGSLVRTVAWVSNEQSIKLFGGLVDKLITLLPPVVATKTVALVVEAAAHAGRIHPTRAREKF